MATVLELIDAEVEAFDSNVETGSLDSFGVTTRKATTTAKAGGLSVFIPTPSRDKPARRMGHPASVRRD
jgi:hypothetical protein